MKIEFVLIENVRKFVIEVMVIVILLVFIMKLIWLEIFDFFMDLVLVILDIKMKILFILIFKKIKKKLN